MHYVTRRYSFSAAHQLFAPQLSREENERLYGKCCYTHGHEYILEITWKGKIQPQTGRLLTPGLEDTVQERVITFLDRSYLNKKEIFARQAPTGENLLREIWRLLVSVKAGPELHKLRLTETRNNAFEYYGEEGQVLAREIKN